MPVPSDPAEFFPYFELTGRISVRDGQRGESARLHWLRTPGSQRIELISPLGGIVAEISQDEGADAILRTADSERRSSSLELLTREILGNVVPVDRIAFWLQGDNPHDSSDVVEARDMFGRPQRLSSNAWNVAIEGYRRVGTAIVATRINATSGARVMKLVIDEWKPLP